MISDFSLENAPLRANLSIEASAGTGKTYTLEQIVCRLVEQYDLSIKQILLVTYTEKAAEELRQRIRCRLNLRLKEACSPRVQRNILQALNQFGEANISTIHSFFCRCLEQFSLETGQSGIVEIDPNVQPVRELLLDELQQSDFDEQSKRMLRLSGLSTSISDGQKKFRLQKLLDICEDRNLENFWRGYPGFKLCPGEAELEELERIRQEFVHESGHAYLSFSQLAQFPWVEAIFANRSSKKKLKNLPKNYDATTALGFFRQLRDLLHGDCLNDRDSLDCLLQLLLQRPSHPKNAKLSLAPHIELLCCLHPHNLEQNNEKFLEANGSLEAWPYYEQSLQVEQFFVAFGGCYDWQNPRSLQSFFAAEFLLKLRQKIAPNLQMSQLLHGIRSFSDIVEGLYRVLVLEQHGDPQSLFRSLREQYRCVLVDEFQDTDPIQWQILFRIFGVGTTSTPSDSSANEGPHRSHNYIIVGDPKQSIYRFRGGSVQLYKLVQQTCDHRFRLGANYRSNLSLIGACNQFFAAMWGPSFEPVNTGRTDAPFLQGPLQRVALLQEYSGLCFLDCDVSGVIPDKSELQQASLGAIEQQVLRLLSQDYQIAQQPVQPGDIAILMGRKSNCAEMYQRLQALGIPAQYSEKRSVFLDRNAQSLHYFFLALCYPRKLSHSLRLLLSPLFGLNMQEAQLLLQTLEPIPGSEQALAQVSKEETTELNEFSLSFIQKLFCWQEQVDQGLLLDVLQELFTYGRQFYRALQSCQGSARPELQQDVYSRLLGRPQYMMAAENLTSASLGELQKQNNCESYNNLRDLVEILANEQFQRGIGCRELSHFVAQQIKRAETGTWELSGTEQQNSTGGQAVHIMTIHASKGLEFPVVLLGIGWSEERKDAIILQSDLEAKNQVIRYEQTAYLAGNSAVQTLADQEQYAELQRLFYVALTRASCKIYLPFHSACKKPIPYFELLKESLPNMGDLRVAVDTLVQEFPQYFSWESSLPKLQEELQDLQKQLRQRFLSGQGATPCNFGFQSRENLLFEEHPLASSQPVRELQNDNLARRFPVVSSFTSLQRSLEAAQKPSEEAEYSEETGYMTDGLDSFQDKEHYELPTAMEFQIWEQKELCWHELLLSPGAELGKLLHDLLENVDYQMIAQVNANELIEDSKFFEQLSLQSRCYFPRNWIRRAYPALCRIIWHTLHSNLVPPLTPQLKGAKQAALRLCQLSKEQRQHELEFLLSIPQDCRIDSQLFLQETTGKIQISKGFLKGFIDLLFLHNGKLYLLDWKSNFSSSSHLLQVAVESKAGKQALRYLQQQLYHPEALQQLMASHRYQMQYLIYLAAVYYYLKLQYGDTFQYSQHFGGCYYLFLRGMGQGSNGTYFHKPAEEFLVHILQGLGISGNEK